MIKRILSLTLLASTPALSWAQGAFEGVITMTTTNAEIKETTDVSWYLKGENSRMDMRSNADGQSTEYAIISDSKGMDMDMVAQGHVTPIPAKEMRTGNTNMTLLDESKGHRVNGYDCVRRVYTDGTNDITYWLATGTGIGYSDLPMFLRRNMPRLEAGQFPVKMEKRDPEGKLLMSQDVSAIRAQKVDDTLFSR